MHLQIVYSIEIKHIYSTKVLHRFYNNLTVHYHHFLSMIVLGRYVHELKTFASLKKKTKTK